jgi:hypothetical protein
MPVTGAHPASLTRNFKERPMTAIRTCAVICALLCSTHAPVIADVGPVVAKGRIVTWLAEDNPPPGTLVVPARVFGAEFPDPGSIPPGGSVTVAEPGFLTLPGNELEGFSLGFNIRGYLRQWDVASQSVPDAPAVTGMTLSAPLIGVVSTPLSGMLVPGLIVPQVAFGGFDFHFDHELHDNVPGVYVLELELFTNRPGVGGSLPYWVVFNYGLPEPEHGAALKWVEANLVPAPGAAAAFACLLLTKRRSR